MGCGGSGIANKYDNISTNISGGEEDFYLFGPVLCRSKQTVLAGEEFMYVKLYEIVACMFNK